MEYMTVKQVANKLQVSEYTVRDWVKLGNLKAHKFGHKTIRIPIGEVVKFIDRHETAGAV